MSRLKQLQPLLQQNPDDPLLRFCLAQEYIKANELTAAINHLKQAITLKQNYSAAWKLLGKAYEACQDHEQAIISYQQGIIIAKQNKDIQSAKEMTVFLRRIEKKISSSDQE